MTTATDKVDRAVILETQELLVQGWCKKHTALDAQGELCNPHGLEAVCWCLTGALARATNLVCMRNKRQSFPNAHAALRDPLHSHEYKKVYNRVAERFRMALNLLTIDQLFGWNDALFRRKKHLFELIDRVLDKIAEEEGAE